MRGCGEWVANYSNGCLLWTFFLLLPAHLNNCNVHKCILNKLHHQGKVSVCLMCLNTYSIYLCFRQSVETYCRPQVVFRLLTHSLSLVVRRILSLSIPVFARSLLCSTSTGQYYLIFHRLISTISNKLYWKLLYGMFKSVWIIPKIIIQLGFNTVNGRNTHDNSTNHLWLWKIGF